MKSCSIDNTYEKKRPVRARFSRRQVALVVDGEEYMSNTSEVWEGTSGKLDILLLHEQENNRGSQQKYAGLGIRGKINTFEVPVATKEAPE